MLVAPAAKMANGDAAPMMDKNNIINVRDGESLYQICLKLRRRLAEVPGFGPYLDKMEEQEADGVTDPVSSLWRCFRSGLPLLTIYNASQPEEGILEVDTSKDEKRVGKEATSKFIMACIKHMEIPAQEIFSVSDLYNDNTTGFVKVTKSVNHVLDILGLSGQLHRSTDSDDLREEFTGASATNGMAKQQLTRRQHILKELVETERQYVHHLLNLQALKKELEEIGALTGDSIHNIFLNLNNLLDFAQRFLIRIEQHNELPEESQNWGDLFIHYKEPFRQYEPFIANQRRCETTCQKEWDKMVAASRSPLMKQMLSNPTILNGFLLKPMVRLTKYPLLLKDLQSQIESKVLKEDLAGAIEIIQSILQQANASIAREEREDALVDLNDRVEDWKSLRIDSFGELMLFGTFSVLKGDGGGKDQEKEVGFPSVLVHSLSGKYHIYLFQRILLCCKDMNLNKQKGKTKSTISLRGKPRLQLKGRIFLANVTHVVVSTGPGNYTIQIFWKGDPNVENFIIKFKNEDTLRRWERDIEAHKEAEIARAQKNNSTSATQFTFLAGIEIENPHQEFDADDDDYTPMGMSRPPTYGSGTTEPPGYSEFSMSRNPSSNSLRSRSATGGSVGSAAALASMGRPPQRFVAPDIGSLPPLNTQIVREASSPGDRFGNSYFSPIERDSTPPHSSSTRSSSQSTFAGYNRYAPPSHPRSNGEEPNRNTAPAMSRNMTGSTIGGNPYLANGRGLNMRPSLPPSGTVQSAQQLGMTINRMRSASSPDIHPNGLQTRRYANSQSMPNGENVPNVPPIPPHVAKQMAPINRSQNNSPVYALPIRNGNPASTGQQQYGLPPGPRPSMPNHLYTYDAAYKGQMDPRQYAQGSTQLSISTAAGALSPPLSTPSSDGEAFMPSQLKAKVRFDDNYISIVIASNIQFRSLIDRIDAKLARFTNHSIGSGSVRLKYQDEDEDFIWIDSDEAIHEALLDWRETHVEKIAAGQLAEILLYAQSVNGEPIAGHNQT